MVPLGARASPSFLVPILAVGVCLKDTLEVGVRKWQSATWWQLAKVSSCLLGESVSPSRRWLIRVLVGRGDELHGRLLL